MLIHYYATFYKLLPCPFVFFFFSSRRRHTRYWRDWSSDVCSSDLLDNTLRIRRIVPTDWVLCDIRILGIHGGFGHGAMYLFARDGELMATASQSVIVRVREDTDDR